MSTRIARGCTALALAALLAGCSGGGSQRSALPNQPAARGSASVGLHVVIPKKSGSAARRSVKHLPSSTKSMAVKVNGGAPQVVGLQSTDPGCSADPVSGNTVCNATVLAPIGNDTFDLTAYDAAGGTGNVLSHASVARTVVAGTNDFPIALGGVVASLGLSAAAGAVYEGAATTTATASVVAADADGNVIMDAYDQSVTITGSGAFAGTSGTLAQSGDSLTLVYDGTDPANVGPTTFSAAIGGSTVPLTVTGPVVSNPKNLAAANVALWYDAADASSVSTDGTTTFTWKDKSGNAKDVASSGTPLPTYPDTAVRDAKHALIDFTPGTPASAGPPAVPATPGAFLSRLDGFPGGDYSVFAVAYNTRADSSGSAAGGSPGSIIGGGIGTRPNGHGLLLVDFGTLCLYEANANCTAVTAAAGSVNPSFANTIYRVTGIADSVANTGSIAINGATGPPGFASGTMPARTADPSVVINGYGNDGLTSGTNSIAEIVVLDHVASASEQSAIESYLKAKWTLP